MSQQAATFLLRGGLNLVTPPVAVRPGQLIAGVNYEPDAGGYTRLAGYERFDGQPSPSNGANAAAIAARRAAIQPVPGTGPVRGVWIYDGNLYAIRDTSSGNYSQIWKDGPRGWAGVAYYTTVLTYTAGTEAFEEGDTLVGGTSGATATIHRAVHRTGTFAGNDATGYLVPSSTSGTFQPGETITGTPGSATLSAVESRYLEPGGNYVFANHNFYGPARRPRMYFASGVQPAMEFDGTTLAPILSGNADGPVDTADFILNRGGGKIKVRSGGRVILRYDHDIPQHIAEYSNHLFLGFRNGGILFSGVGEPLDFRPAVGAGSFSFTDEITGFLSGASTALIIFGRNRVDYLTGNDSSDFVQGVLSDGSGAYAYTAQMLDQPFFLDDAGLRKLTTADAFGDWRLGTVTQPVEPLMRAKRLAGVRPAASLKVKNRDQYRLFWDDGTGLIVYFGRKEAEAIPMKLPIDITCACSGEVSTADGGERLFVGSSDGYVYELDRGTSFDGDPIPAYARVAWNTIGVPMQNKRFHKMTLDVDAPSDIELGVAHHVDFGRRQDGAGGQVDFDVSGGSRADLVIADYGDIDWTQADQGLLEYWLDAFGQNIAVTLISESATEEPHTLTSMTLNYSPRRLER